jgi:hypothetical protein
MDREVITLSVSFPTGLSPARFPDVYYQVRPVVEETISEMDDPYLTYPSQQAVDRMVNRTYEKLLMTYPDLEELEESLVESDGDTVETQIRFGPPRFRRAFRRREIFRDLVTILLLNELFRRRGYYY